MHYQSQTEANHGASGSNSASDEHFNALLPVLTDQQKAQIVNMAKQYEAQIQLEQQQAEQQAKINEENTQFLEFMQRQQQHVEDNKAVC